MNKTIRLPGLIDTHVHVREPGTLVDTWKDTTRAAIIGGITHICVMPNMKPPIVDVQSFNRVLEIAKRDSMCKFSLYMGSTRDNYNDQRLPRHAVAKKMYLNPTYTGDLLNLDNNLEVWDKHFKYWESPIPIMAHAEKHAVENIIKIAMKYDKRVHICHVSRKKDLEFIIETKKVFKKLTCEVCPHHLFLTNMCVEKDLSYVKPPLEMSEDNKFMWDNLEHIDCFVTDHAPHSLECKRVHKCPGFPSLEQILKLFMTEVYVSGRLTLEDLVNKMFYNPMKIMNLPIDSSSYIEFTFEDHIIGENVSSKLKWNPYIGRKVCGYTSKVVINDDLHYDIDISGNITKHEKVKRCLFVRHKPYGLLNILDIDRDYIDEIFAITDRNLLLDYNKNLLEDKVIGLVFNEPSTRTRGSFEVAIKKLGGTCVDFSSNTSRMKGESEKDTIRTVENYADCIIFRSLENDLCDVLPEDINTRVINAGNGSYNHPTQALIDLYTIHKNFDDISKLVICFVGDIFSSRTVRSLIEILVKYDIGKIYFCSSDREISLIDNYIVDLLGSHHVDFQFVNSFDEIIDKVDIVYMTRYQSERHDKCVDYSRYKLTLGLVNKMRENAIVMHPMPRNDELSIDIDDNHRAKYFDQSRYGVYIRMAILEVLMR